MSPLLPLLRTAARDRGLLAADEAVTAERAVALVRAMPYGRGLEETDGEAVVRAWRGTAVGKHALLGAVLQELGYDTSMILATHEFSTESAPWLPPHLLEEAARAPVPDVHAFLRVRTDPVADEWTTVDVTWPLAARDLGLPANEGFTPGTDERIACDPIEFVHVFDEDDLAEVLARILDDHAPGEQGGRRARFLDGLAAWVAEQAGA